MYVALRAYHCLTRDLQNSRYALTLFAILQGKVITFLRYVAYITYIFLEI